MALMIEIEKKGAAEKAPDVSAAKAILAAIKSGDAAALNEALREHAACCEEMGMDEEDEEDE
jgi:DNA-binding GntR family transcriptional regulator